MKLKKLLVFAASAALALTACTGKGSDKPKNDDTPIAISSNAKLKGEIKFQTWSLKNKKFMPYFEKLIKDFEKQHPGTKIIWMDQPGGGYEDKVLQQANSDDLPDVVNLSDGFAAQLAKLGKIINLKKADPEGLKLYVPGGLAGYTFKDIEGTYAYPWYLGTDLSWWNMAQLKKAGVKKLPTNMDEMLKVAKEAAIASKKEVRLISDMPKMDTLQDEGIEVFKDGKFVFNKDPKSAELIQKYVDLYQAGAMPPESLNADYAGNNKLFLQGKVGFTTGTSSLVTELVKNAPNLVKDVEVSKRLVKPPLFVQGLSLAKNSKNKELALAFARFVTNDHNQTEFVKLAQGFLPGTVEANKHPESFTATDASPLTKKAVKLAAEEMKEAKPNTIVQYTDDMKKYLAQQLGLAMKKKIKPQEALDAAAKYCNKSI